MASRGAAHQVVLQGWEDAFGERDLHLGDVSADNTIR